YINAANLSLTLDDVVQPIWLENGDDGSFDPGDAFTFYGRARNDLYAAANVYILQGADPAPRMGARDLTTNPDAPLALDFPTTLHFEENSYYWQTMPNGAGQDHWFWNGPINGKETLTVTLSVPNIAPSSGYVSMQIQLRGRTTAQTAPNHHTRIVLNGEQIDDRLWAGQVPFTHTVTLSHTLLNAGDNTLIVKNVGDTQAAVDVVFLDWVSVDYRRTFTATDDLLTMTPRPGAQQFEITSFADADLMIFDISDPQAPVRLLGAEITPTPAHADAPTYSLRFADTVADGARYLVLSAAAVRQPARITIDALSNWRSPAAHGADSILITHAEFVTATQRLAEFHRSQGLRTVVVDVDDLYDEFSHSQFTPEAIRDFIAYAYDHWPAPAPTYVTLIGDATIDYRDHQQTGTHNFVPTALTQTYYLGDTPTDNWFVAVSGDDPLPDLFIGRISVDSIEQADAVIDKIIGYTPPANPAVGRAMLMVADDDSDVFRVANQQVTDVLPPGFLVDTIDAADFPPGDPSVAILDALTRGRAFVHYSGHGAVFSWGTWGPEQDKRIFTTLEVNQLPAGSPLQLLTVANCINGFFGGHSYSVSMAETFQRLPEGGALAVWAPTGFSYPAGHLELMKAFYATLLGDGAPGDTVTLGAAVAAAKITIYTQSVFWTELVETYTLFGDPSQRLTLPGYPVRGYLPQVWENDGS
ncbi:MAG: hypothetical protein KDD84_00730, partial [Caldilineaceae bacterium]|nr:hypothetical protein [Caldilineaceae bacterium]